MRIRFGLFVRPHCWHDDFLYRWCSRKSNGAQSLVLREGSIVEHIQECPQRKPFICRDRAMSKCLTSLEAATSIGRLGCGSVPLALEIDCANLALVFAERHNVQLRVQPANINSSTLTSSTLQTWQTTLFPLSACSNTAAAARSASYTFSGLEVQI
jgi:hypothetical protein